MNLIHRSMLEPAWKLSVQYKVQGRLVVCVVHADENYVSL